MKAVDQTKQTSLHFRLPKQSDWLKMEYKTKKLPENFFCKVCSLQFFSKPVFDFHKFHVHQQSSDTEQNLLNLKKIIPRTLREAPGQIEPNVSNMEK